MKVNDGEAMKFFSLLMCMYSLGLFLYMVVREAVLLTTASQ